MGAEAAKDLNRILLAIIGTPAGVTADADDWLKIGAVRSPGSARSVAGPHDNRTTPLRSTTTSKASERATPKNCSTSRSRGVRKDR